MNFDNQNIVINEIDIGGIIQKLWKEKLLILSISLIFSILGYIYSSLKPIKFETTIVLKSIPMTLFDKFDNAIKLHQQQQEQQQQEQYNFSLMFKEGFQQKLNSFDNIDNFVELNNKINTFKALLKKKNISAKDYFLNGNSKNKFGNEKERNTIIENRYYLHFPQALKGDDFLNEYVLFTYQNSLKVIKNEIISIISVKKYIYDKHLSIAQELNIQEPILQQKIQDRSLFLLNEPEELYYSGVKVIQNEIASLNDLIVDTKNLKLDFNPILDKASKPIVVSQPPLKFGILGFILGLLLSLTFILFKNVLKSKE
jgi:LPS O-antigen subunit length determinant protein (WzzB/FepE family)